MRIKGGTKLFFKMAFVTGGPARLSVLRPGEQIGRNSPQHGDLA